MLNWPPSLVHMVWQHPRGLTVLVELIGWVWKRLGLVGWVWEGQGLITVDLLELVFFITVVENRELSIDITNGRMEAEVSVQPRSLNIWMRITGFLISNSFDKILLLFFIRYCLIFILHIRVSDSYP